MKTVQKYIFLALSILIFFVACHDDLNNYPLDKYSEDKVWNTAASAQLFVNQTLNVKDLLLSKSNNWSDDWCDDMVINSQMSAAQRTVREIMTSDNNDYEWNKFAEIRRCNLIIEKVGASDNMTDSEKEYLIAQAKMLRGIINYVQARKFGRIVIIDKVLTPTDNLMLPRTETIKDTYDFIITDLQESALFLPQSTVAGNLSKGAAYALLAEVALHGASYLDNNSQKAAYYAISKKASEDLFQLNEYELDADYDKLFNDFSNGLSSNEIILGSYWMSDNTTTSGTWKIKFAPNQGSSNKLPAEIAAVWPLNDSFEGWFEKSPSQEFIDAYLVVDMDGVAKQWNESSYFLNFRQNIDFVSQAIYKNRDARFYATIAYDSTQYMNSIITTRLGGNMYYKNNLEKDQHMTKTGYFYKKGSYLDKTKVVYYSVKMDFHLTPLRLGRSYLNYAEVLLRLGDTAKAIEYINKTRTTHGQLPPLSTGLSKEETWETYKNERRVELVLENDRYWSLLRWGKEEGLSVIPELNTPPTAIEISEDGKSFRFMDVPVVAGVNNRNFTSRRYFLPIPKTEIISNENLTNDQNKGWE